MRRTRRGVARWMSVALVFLSCASPRTSPPELAALPVAIAPSGVYETILEKYAAALGAEYVVVEDKSQICYDFEHRHSAFPGYFESLSVASQEAHRDCRRKGEVKFRVPAERFDSMIEVRARSALSSHEPNLTHPTVFLSRPGISSDGSVLVVAAGYHCGMLCSTSDLFVFVRGEEGWVLSTNWTLFVS